MGPRHRPRSRTSTGRRRRLDRLVAAAAQWRRSPPRPGAGGPPPAGVAEEINIGVRARLVEDAGTVEAVTRAYAAEYGDSPTWGRC